MSIDWKDYLSTQGARFQDAVLSGFDAQPASRHANALSVLSQRAFIAISGVDAQKFLQGQLSVHMEQLDKHQQRLGVACTPKGRMYTSFRILNQDNGYILSMDQSVVDATLATLKKYAVFFKAELQINQALLGLGVSGHQIIPELQKLGLTVPESGEAIPIHGGHLIRIPGLIPRFELWIGKNTLPHWWEALTPIGTPCPDALWQLLDIEAVLPRITASTQEKYIPQHLNMPTLGGVSFRKGCYTGQEIVTRMQSLGQQKSRTYRLLAAPQESIQCGDKVYDEQGKGIGEVIAAEIAPDTDSLELLAVIRIHNADLGTAYLDEHQNQKASIQALPYTVDSKGELQQ